MTGDELNALERVHHILWEFRGAEAWQKAEAAVEQIEWLRRELSISQHNEKAAHAVLQQERVELYSLRAKVRYAQLCMEANDPFNARSIFGPPMPVRETTDDQPRGAQ